MKEQRSNPFQSKEVSGILKNNHSSPPPYDDIVSIKRKTNINTEQNTLVSESPPPQDLQTSHKKRKAVLWDEENIDICEKNKSSTQKIDEPKTPFIQRDDKFYLDEYELLKGEDLSSALIDAKEKMETTLDSSEWEEEEEILLSPQEMIEKNLQEEAKRQAFLDKRKKHYNEYPVSKSLHFASSEK